MAGRVIAVASQKGGVGKTTTAVNLAASLAVLERRVLLVELDPQGAIAPCFGFGRHAVKGGVYDVVVRGQALPPFVLTVKGLGLGIVPINVWSDDQEEAYLMACSRHALVGALAGARAEYDYVILDNPPTIGPVAVAALSAADSLLVPVQCEEMAVATLGKLFRTARRVKSNGNPALGLEGILLTMADPKAPMTREVVDKLRRAFGAQVFGTVVPRCPDLARVMQRGEPALFTRAWSPGAQAYLKLAGELLRRPGAAAA